MRNLLITELLIVAGLMLIIGCNEPPHQVEMSPPQISEGEPDGQQPKLEEIRPLDAGESDVVEPGRGEDPPTITEVTTNSQNNNSSIIYRVKHGDTFWKIAKTQLGDGQRYREVLKLNPNVDPRALRIGQPIRLPKK